MLAFYTFIVGLFFGSFFLVVIDRLPRNKTVLKGRSHCDHCKHTLAWYDLIPLFSFLSTGGKCRYCHKKLSFYYPFIEFLTGVLFGVTALFLPALFTELSWWYVIKLLFYEFVVSCFIIIFFTDIKYGIIPDKIVFPATYITLLYLLFFSPTQLPMFLVSGFCAFVFFLLLFLGTKSKGMGFGDVKLVFWLGLLLGLQKVALAIYVAFILGAVVALVLIVFKRKRLRGSTIPFGPFLVLGAFIMLFFGDTIVRYISNYL